MDENKLKIVFEDAVTKQFNSKVKLAQELKSLLSKGLVYFYIPVGKCLMRPEIRILSDCIIYAKSVSDMGSIKNYKFVLEVTPYESFSFNKSS